MLFPQQTPTRTVLSLDGIWRFRFDPEAGRAGAGLAAGFAEAPLAETVAMPVPSAWNDLFEDQTDRDFVGWVWYERDFEAPRSGDDDDVVIRFGSATHRAIVWVNGVQVGEHRGGFLPFDVAVRSALQPGANRLTVAISTVLDNTTVPIGTYSEEDVPGFGRRIRNTPNFDFFNYTGLQRSVQLCLVPRRRVDDISIVSDYAGSEGRAAWQVTLHGDVSDGTPIEVHVIDAAGAIVATGRGSVAGNRAAGEVTIPDVHLWKPGDGYLYRLRVALGATSSPLDVYTERFGVRRVEVRDSQFLINGEPFYFKGFGKHEDSALRGRGTDSVVNVKDLRLMKWMGANSLRTSHYPYSDEFMRLCDEEGIVVIDETPAVGLMAGFTFDIGALMAGRGERKSTWETLDCAEAHRESIRAMIARDKNHPSVVMWSIANEPASGEAGAGAYFAPMFDLARECDPQKRPVTCVLLQHGEITKDEVAPLADVIAINRYYGWYFASGEFAFAKAMLARELAGWAQILPGKPVMITEYGADTVAGLHDTGPVMFTEEYQVAYYEANHEVFDRFPHVVGEHAWNFADFATSQNVLRVQGNRKGIFTRDRQPKQAAFMFQRRWSAIPDFGFTKEQIDE